MLTTVSPLSFLESGAATNYSKLANIAPKKITIHPVDREPVSPLPN